MRYENGRPIEIERILISTQHKDGVDAETLIKPDLWEHVVHPVLPGRALRREEAARRRRHNFLVNPTGKFVIGGPVGDAGLTGRKIIVDTYGGMARHGGGAFSGQGPVEGRPLGRLRRALRGEERGRRRPRRPLRGAGGLRDRRRAPGVGDGRDVRHREDRARQISSSSTSTSTCARARSATTSTCTGRSTRRPPPTATSAARTTTSRGRRPTRPTTLREAAGLGERDAATV